MRPTICRGRKGGEPVYVLGVSCYYHDAAAALLQDGMLVAAAEEERFSQVKHDYLFPKNAIRFCLDQAGIDGRDLDYVVFFEKPFRKFERILMTVLQTYPKSWKVFRESMISWMIDNFWIGTRLQRRSALPAITHVDGTNRLQMVFRDQSPRYYRLIQRFGDAAGVPVVLNTSFNLKDELIVNEPADAFHAFSSSEMDSLVLENSGSASHSCS